LQSEVWSTARDNEKPDFHFHNTTMNSAWIWIENKALLTRVKFVVADFIKLVSHLFIAASLMAMHVKIWECYVAHCESRRAQFSLLDSNGVAAAAVVIERRRSLDSV